MDAELTPQTGECDVAVIGGGPIGTLYASFLKRRRPATRIVVLERAVEPGHKIGESTLSGFCKAVCSVGVRQEALRALFYPKNGLGFHYIDESIPDVARAPEYVLETFDETFQVERRVLDSLLIAHAHRLGVEVIQGARVDLECSTLGGQGSVLAYQRGGRTHGLRCALVADASGPNGVLARHYGLQARDGVPFQTSAVWAYFSGVQSLADYPGWTARSQFPRDQYTQHLCFSAGWLWYIPLVSWQSVPASILRCGLDRVLDPATAPTRSAVMRDLGGPASDIVSIGLVLRGDRDGAIREDPRRAFEHYRRRYPAIARLLSGARLLDDYYGRGRTYMSRLAFRSHARRVAGDGWLLLGDAAFFVDPLISPGLTGGAAGAYRAAEISSRALDLQVFDARFFSPYQEFVGRLHDALERDNQLVYMSFNHPEAIALVQRLQEIDARRHFLENEGRDYGPQDTNVWGILAAPYQELQQAAWAVLREEEEAVGRSVPVGAQSPAHYRRAVLRLRRLLGPYLKSQERLTPFTLANRGTPGAAPSPSEEATC